jgi:hypothetical protein
MTTAPRLIESATMDNRNFYRLQSVLTVLDTTEEIYLNLVQPTKHQSDDAATEVTHPDCRSTDEEQSGITGGFISVFNTRNIIFL